jgi:hypothetical protein
MSRLIKNCKNGFSLSCFVNRFIATRIFMFQDTTSMYGTLSVLRVCTVRYQYYEYVRYVISTTSMYGALSVITNLLLAYSNNWQTILFFNSVLRSARLCKQNG